MRRFRVGLDATFGYAREVVEAGSFLVLTPVMASWLGAEGFGLWSLAWATMALLGLLELGLQQAVVKFVAQSTASAAEAREVTATLFWTHLGLAGIGLALTGAVAATASGTLSVPGDRTQEFEALLLLLGARVSLGIPAGCLHGVLSGLARQRWSHLVRAGEALLYLALVLLLARGEPDLARIGVASLGTSLTTLPILVALVMRTGEVSLSPTFVRTARIPEMVRFGGHFLVIQVAMLLYARADAILIQAFLPVAAVGAYAVAARIAEKAGAFCRQLTNALTPALAHRAAASPDELVELVVEQARRSMWIATPLLFGLCALAAPLVVGWMGPEFDAGAAPLAILSLAVWCAVLHAPSANLLAMTGHERFVSRVFVGGQVLNIALTVLLLPTLGLIGAAAATLISTLACDIGLVQRRVAAVHGLPVRRYYASVLGASLPAAVALGVTALPVGDWMTQVGPSLPAVALAEVVLAGVFALILRATLSLRRALANTAATSASASLSTAPSR